MPRVVAYQFLPSRRPAVVRRLLSRLPQDDVIAVFDLEDSAADVLNPARTPQLKADSRANLGALLDGGWRPLHRLAIRVNPRTSPDHTTDLELVADVLRRGYKVSLLLPKVERPADVLDAAGFFTAHGQEPPRFLLLAETGAGLRTLDATLAAGRQLVDAVLLGMIDYCHDQRIWPFYGPLDERLWAVANTVAAIAAAHRVGYVHAACLQLRNAALIREIRRRLPTTSARGSGMITLSLDQTLALLSPESEAGPSGPVQPASARAADTGDPSAVDPTFLAREVVSRFESHQHAAHSFSVDTENDRFIPPQEYLSARRFLHSAEGSLQ